MHDTKTTYKNCFLLLLLYFIGYMYVVPFLGKEITLWLNPSAHIMNLPILLVFYVLVLITAFLLTKKVWKQSIINTRENFVYGIKLILVLAAIMLALNMLLSILLMLITHTQNSVNQDIIRENTMVAPAFTLVTDCLIAPFLEETIFRAGLFTALRRRFSFFLAAIISSIAFGSIHVMDSIITGNFMDLPYLILYAVIGMIFAYAYEKSNSVCTSVGIHMINNVVASMILFM